jgi:hypothetical protein
VRCRFCGHEVVRTFLDLGMQPLSNAYVRPERSEPEKLYPLHAKVCDECLLVQLPELASPDSIFSDYAYLSSMSSSWVEHARRFAEGVVPRFRLTASSRVVEIASNDGYLLRHFQTLGVSILGVEPAANVAEIARRAGIPTRVAFFGPDVAEDLVRENGHARLVVANNVLAHVPDLNGFVRGLRTLVGESGVVSIECPHLARLIDGRQFDTIYHEHFSYFSLGTLMRVLAAHDLSVFDVETLPTHGGSLRVFAQRTGGPHEDTGNAEGVLTYEDRAGGRSLARYVRFESEVRSLKKYLLAFLHDERARGRRIAGYGAPAKGNTLLNYLGLHPDTVEFTVDKNPLKQGTLLPGSRIPVFAPEHLRQEKPDTVVLFPWNLEAEIVPELSFVRDWGGQIVVPLPEVRIAA